MKIIGLISGTSMDGIDAALCDISGAPPNVQARIIKAILYPYPPGMQERILRACLPAQSHVDELCQLNAELGDLFARAAQQVMTEAGFTSAQVDLIGSHGQTVWHMVLPDGSVSSTLQLTEAANIAERTGITTINNFRARDIAAGGQGAPLASYLDWLLLRHPEVWRAVQNIGGIGNVTFLPPLSDPASVPIAFDTGPGNVLIDASVRIITDGKSTFDRDGLIAQQGQVNETWLADLLAHPYYRRVPPKTTGRELFGSDMGAALVTEGRARGLDDPGIVATLTALTAASIVDAYRNFAPASIDDVIVGGGGARNPVLVRMLGERLAPIAVRTHEAIGLDSDNKEALLFALLAHETWFNRPGNYPTLTGAQRPVVLGQITPGQNFAGLIARTWCDS